MSNAHSKPVAVANAPVCAQFKYACVEEAQEALNELVQCYCCPRHQINKPEIIGLWYELPMTNDYYNECSCDCRHRARWICREMCGNSLVAAHVGVAEEPTDFDSVMDRLEKKGSISSTERESFVKLMMDQNEVAQAAYEVFELDNDEEEIVDTLRRINNRVDCITAMKKEITVMKKEIAENFASSSSDEEAEEKKGGGGFVSSSSDEEAEEKKGGGGFASSSSDEEAEEDGGGGGFASSSSDEEAEEYCGGESKTEC